AVLVRHGTGANGNGTGRAVADLTDPEAVGAMLEHIRGQHGVITGLVHLLPLSFAPSGEQPIERMRREVKSLYVLSRHMAEGLGKAGEGGGALLVAGTRLGGGLGLSNEPLPAQYFAGHGGVIGFVKCLALEWPEVLVRVVDLNLNKSTNDLVEHLLAELS